MSDIVERLAERASLMRGPSQLDDLMTADWLDEAVETIRSLRSRVEWLPVSEFNDEHCRKPCWAWGPKRVAPTIALADFADGLWFHEVRNGTAPWSHWSDIDEDEPLIDNDGFSAITHFMLLQIPTPPLQDVEGESKT